MAGIQVLSDSEVSSTMVTQNSSAVVLAVADSVADSVAEIKDSIHPGLVQSGPLIVPDSIITHVPSGLLGSTDNTTLQGLLSNSANFSGASFLGQTDGIQIITVANPVDFMTSADGAPNRVWQIVPGASPEIATIVAVQDSHFDTGVQLENQTGSNEVSSIASSDPMPHLMLTKPVTQHVLPPKCPSWAARLKSCEKIGDSYRGYVESEVELDLLLTYHKQQTQSFWGTRQSPSQSRVSKRLMWKSQYVPMDGIPFINSGSRAVVMECQYGPRRKGFPQKKDGDTGPIEIVSAGELSPLNHPISSASGSNTFRKTCPARIYIKKVKKFLQYAVDPNLEKKHLKAAMDKSFQALRNRLNLATGQERYYVQLPAEGAHEFHNVQECETPEVHGQRLHPRVVEKVRELVADGETRLYAVRKAIRTFVSCELFSSRGEVPERHDLTYFPTVNDLKNHIHAALADIENGTLPFTAQSVNLEVMANSDGGSEQENDIMEIKQVDNTIWQPTGGEGDGPTPETVTVTLTQHPGEGGHHVISRIETHLSDGTTHISDSLTPETAQLLSNLHPSMFPGGCDGVIKLPGQENSAEEDKECDPDNELTEDISTLPAMEVSNVSIHDTNVDDSEIHVTAIPDTEIPETGIHDTEAPGTEMPETGIHDTEIHDTEIHDTEMHDTEIPDTEIQETQMIPVSQDLGYTTTETEESTTEGEITDGTVAELIQSETAS